jgi:hypothetical protein
LYLYEKRIKKQDNIKNNNAMSSKIESAINAVDAALPAYLTVENTRQERNKLLYAPTTGMMDTDLMVKEYVKGA